MWALLVLAACSGGDGSPTATPIDPPAVEPTLVLSPTAYTLEALGDTVQLQALLRGGNGESAAAPQVTWTALDPDIAMVDEEGRVRSLSPGDARVLASSRGKTDTARIRVTQSVATLTVDPANPTITVDASLQMRALAFDRKGAPVTGLQIEWTSSDGAVAPVTNDGSVYAKAAGTATVTARVGGKTASTSVAVTAAVPVVASITLSPASPTVQVGATVLMQTVVQDAAGRPIGVDLAWSSSNPGVASVSPEGLVTGRAAGTATVTVTAGGKSLSTLVTVPAPPPVVASIAVTPANPTVAIGATAQMQAVVRDAEGVTIPGVPLSWGSSAEGVATVSPAGVVTAKAAGTASIVVTGGGKTTSTLVTVPAPPPVVASIILTPANPTVAIGATAQMQAEARNDQGAAMTGVALSWSSSNEAVASVSAAGLVTAKTAGTANITVAGGGKSTATTVTVPAAPPAVPVVTTITLSPANPTVAIGAMQQMQAVVRDADGAVMTGVALTWASSNTNVAHVSAAGLVTARAAGTATISVVAGDKTTSTVVTVPAPVVATITLTPANPTVAIGASQQMQAVAKDAGGATIGGVAWTWTSSNANVAAVSSAGYVFGKAGGTAVITVAGGGKSATTTVTVPTPPAPPPPPPPTGTPLASHGFEDGTFGPFVYPWTQFPGDARVVADTTGAGKGKVLRIRYGRTSTAQSNDVNRGLFYGFPGGHRPGQTLYVGGDLFIPTLPATMESQNRKLMYWFPLDEPGVHDPDWLVVRAWGHDLSVEASVGTVPTVIGTARGAIAFAAWQRLETQITLNSSPTASDGTVRVWVNGVLKIEATGLRLITKANPTYAGYKEVGIGYQVNASMLYEESRYWDRLVVSSGRIGQ
jgi:uncharacterized protein YjdB